MLFGATSRAVGVRQSPRDHGSFALRTFGALCIAVGLAWGGYLGWQHWGTGLHTARVNDELRQEFLAALPADVEADTAAPVTAEVAPQAPALARPADPAPPAFVPEGDAVAIVRIPAIDLDMVAVQGTSLVDLRSGPGHYINTAMPGDGSTVGFAGHRTTYGAPFWDLDRVAAGDEIEVLTERGLFTYRVSGTEIATPTSVEVLEPTAGETIVLTTCHPRGSDRQRLVVFGELVPVLGS